jgi:hypothetical protein
VVGILTHAAFTSPSQLLTIGAVVWITLVIAFALGYWHLDRGGPAWSFPEENLPGGDASGWFSPFIDYFALSFTTATAFGPTDVSAIRHWSKLVMILESAISLTPVVLVVARAVNVM